MVRSPDGERVLALRDARLALPLTFGQAVVEPGRAWRRRLPVEVDVRGLPNWRTSTTPPAGGACAKASIPRKRTWVSTAVGAVDHRVGFPGELVVQPDADEAPDDR
jgi:hypothetical protein